MNPGLVVKLRPSGPWRIGPDSGARNRVESIYHSDALYSAVTSAMLRLGQLEEWLDDTARSADAAVRFSSCFPFLEEIGFVVPPRTIWPPTSPALTAAHVRWKSARFVPLSIVQAVLAGQILEEDHWTVDGVSECLLPVGRPGPFRTGVRNAAAVDRLTGATERHSTACLEFFPGAGLWTLVSFRDELALERWNEPVRAAFRYLADSGFGGERSRGWGRAESPEFVDGMLPDLILPPVAEPLPSGRGSETPEDEASVTEPRPPGSGAELEAPSHWLLSLFSPGSSDTVDWTRGDYTVITRAGRVESPARWGEPKKQVNMVAEGSVLVAANAPVGAAPDVAPDGFPHPVFRAGFAVSIPLPRQVSS